MMRFALIPAFATLAACGDLTVPDFRNLGGGSETTAVQAPTEVTVQLTAKERLVAAAEAQGCVISKDNAASVTTAASLSKEELEAALLDLVSEGLAVPNANQALELKTANCAA